MALGTDLDVIIVWPRLRKPLPQGILWLLSSVSLFVRSVCSAKSLAGAAVSHSTIVASETTPSTASLTPATQQPGYSIKIDNTAMKTAKVTESLASSLQPFSRSVQVVASDTSSSSTGQAVQSKLGLLNRRLSEKSKLSSRT